MPEYYYSASVKKTMLGFANLFSDIKIYKSRGAHLDEIRVPLVYTNRSKTVIWQGLPSFQNNLVFTNYGVVLAYELLSISPARDRTVNQLIKMQPGDRSGSFKYARSPYDFSFALYINAIQTDDALQALEQIAPYFNPSINVILEDDPIYGDQDVSITLDSVSTTFQNEGTLNDSRQVEIILSFTARSYLYQKPIEQSLIKNARVNVRDQNTDITLYNHIVKVDPTTASYSDPYEIVETEEHPNE